MVGKLRQALFFVSATALILSQLLAPLGSVAQDAPESVNFVVGAFTCPYDPGSVSLVDGTVPGDCLPAANVPIDIVVNGTENRNCTTGGDGFCLVSVPSDASLLITQLSPDIAVQGSLARSAAEGNAVFVFVAPPAADPTPPTIEPDVTDDEDSEATGDGPAAGTDDGSSEDGNTSDEVMVDASPDDEIVDVATPTPDDGDTIEDIDITEDDGDVVESATPSVVDPASVASPVSDPLRPVTHYEMVVSPTGLTCYSQPDSSSAELATFATGEFLPVNGPTVSPFLPVQCADANGYVYAIGTTIAGQAPGAVTSVEMIVGAGAEGAACLSAPHPEARTISLHVNNGKVAILGTSARGYVPARCSNGMLGYIKATNTTIAAQVTGTWTSVEMIVGAGPEGAACLSAPDPNARVLSRHANNTLRYAYGTSTYGYVPVQCGNGMLGYIKATNTTIAAQVPGISTSVEMIVGVGSEGAACLAAPNPNARVLSRHANNTLRYAYGTSMNGYVPVRCGNGMLGYIKTTNTTIAAQVPGTLTSVEMIIGADSNGVACLAAPDANARVLSRHANNTMRYVHGASVNGYLPVRCGNGMLGYIKLTNTSLSTSQVLKASTGYTAILGAGSTGVVCRSAPDAQATAITSFAEGRLVVTTGDTRNGWVPVQCGGRNGFIAGVSTTRVMAHKGIGGNTYTAKVTGTNSTGLMCRTSPVTGNRITTLPEGAPVEVVSWSEGWAKVKCGGTTGYVAVQYLRFVTGNTSTATGEYWIDINLTTQYMVVYQGKSVLGQIYVSTGRWPLFETPTGNFYINNKVRIQDMAGCSEGECWYVANVEWVMYFTNRGHAFHASPWHNNYGTRMSHGCINLPPAAAEWLYNITPYGTRIYIHY